MSETLGNILLTLFVIPALIFPFVYVATSSWYKTRMGRALFLASITIAALAILALLVMTFGPEYPGKDVAGLIITGMLVITQWFQLVSYIKTVRQVRRAIDDLNDIDQSKE
jgi:hypothetical protein